MGEKEVSSEKEKDEKKEKKGKRNGRKVRKKRWLGGDAKVVIK